MRSYDFEYDGLCLSDFGFTICNFGNGGLDTISNGSQITFNTVPINRGSKYELTSTRYDNCLEATFSICKKLCSTGNPNLDNHDYTFNQEVTQFEMRNIMKWLNRKGYHKFKFLDEDYLNICFEASFNISRYEINDKIYGFELTVVTNRPYGTLEERDITISNTVANGTYRILDAMSDEEGFTYPRLVKVTLKADGNLVIYNSAEDRNTIINNCKSGEVITMSYPIIESSLSTHKITNDFNWNFFRIANTFENKENNLTISLPCTIEIYYSPIAKVGL